MDKSNKELHIITGATPGSTYLEPNDPSSRIKINVPDQLWKAVLILDKPGQGITDVTGDNLAFVIDSPNNRSVEGKDWKDFITNVDLFESVTGYDFFSNIPDPIQGAIEGRSEAEIRDRLNALFPSTAPLLADPSYSEGVPSTV